MILNTNGLIAEQLTSTLGSALSNAAGGPDAAIERDVRTMLAASELGEVTASVRAGVVTLEGAVSDGLPLARFKNKVTSSSRPSRSTIGSSGSCRTAASGSPERGPA